MKAYTLLLVIFVAITAAQAQTRRDIFDPNAEVTWLGLDLSRAKFIGDRERYGSESDMRRLAESWNSIFLKEADKFNVARAIGRKTVKNEIDITTEHNQQLDLLNQYTDNADQAGHMKLSDVGEVINDYDFNGMKGIGLMFIVESFSKLTEQASVWVTFVNMETKEVLLAEKLNGKPGGFGMRNYWANACNDVLNHIKAKDFPRWKNAYGSHN